MPMQAIAGVDSVPFPDAVDVVGWEPGGGNIAVHSLDVDSEGFRDSASGSPVVVDRGATGCSATRPCAACEGDCDSDTECQGQLKCYQRTTAMETVPGCGLPGAT